MSLSTLLQQQITQIHQGGRKVVARKLKRVLKISVKLPGYILAIPVVLVMRLIRPLILVRWQGLDGSRIGHLASITEMYLCEHDAGINLPKQRHIDLFYSAYKPVCNLQLLKMWKRVLHVWPAWILTPVALVNRHIPGGLVHNIGCNYGRDVRNLLDRFPKHLNFTVDEEARGVFGLQSMNIPVETPFVCLIVRDSAYLEAFHPTNNWNYHNFRDSDIQNYVLASEELSRQGYFVIRMGVHVHEAMKTTNPRIIDYSTNGMRTDFMDVYIGAKCDFCISTGTGWDEIPRIFRKPIVCVNLLPLVGLPAFTKEFIAITKHHVLEKGGKELTLREILSYGGDFGWYASDYKSKGIRLIENTPEEIRDVVIEMAERLNGTWLSHEDDESLQQCFLEIFSTKAKKMTLRGQPLHGEIRGRFGAHWLRNNPQWLS